MQGSGVHLTLSVAQVLVKCLLKLSKPCHVDIRNVLPCTLHWVLTCQDFLSIFSFFCIILFRKLAISNEGVNSVSHWLTVDHALTPDIWPLTPDLSYYHIAAPLTCNLVHSALKHASDVVVFTNLLDIVMTKSPLTKLTLRNGQILPGSHIA